MMLTGGDKGTMQLVDEASGQLTIVAHRGFNVPFLEFSSRVHHGTQSACGLALPSAHRIAIENVTQHELFAGHPACEILVGEGIWAVQSTPLLSSNGKVLGMLSTHFLRPTRPTREQLRLARSFATLTGSYLQSRPEPGPNS